MFLLYLSLLSRNVYECSRRRNIYERLSLVQCTVKKSFFFARNWVICTPKLKATGRSCSLFRRTFVQKEPYFLQCEGGSVVELFSTARVRGVGSNDVKRRVSTPAKSHM